MVELVKKILAEITGDDEENISPEDRLSADIGMDDGDLSEFIVCLEEQADAPVNDDCFLDILSEDGESISKTATVSDLVEAAQKSIGG